MSSRLFIIGPALAAAFAIMAGPLDADDFSAHQTSCLKENPPGVDLTLSSRKNVYRLGEAIPVTLTYENQSGTGYRVATQTRDKSGRLIRMAFDTDAPSEDFADPLTPYFATLARTDAGGIGTPPVDIGRYSQNFDLNEWLRFDKPGDYRVFAYAGTLTSQEERFKLLNICSRPITLTILPVDAAADQEVIDKALNDLGSDAKAKRRDAVRRLRFLATPQAVDALVPFLGDRDEDVTREAFFGIVGSRDWAHAKKVLQEKIEDPDTVVNDLYISALTLVSTSLDKDLPFTWLHRDYMDPYKRKLIREWMADNRQEILSQLTAVIYLKKGRALAVGKQILRKNESASQAATAQTTPRQEQSPVPEEPGRVFIELNSGKAVVGILEERTDEFIRVNVEGVPVTYYNDEIKSIVESGSKETPGP